MNKETARTLLTDFVKHLEPAAPTPSDEVILAAQLLAPEVDAGDREVMRALVALSAMGYKICIPEQEQ